MILSPLRGRNIGYFNNSKMVIECDDFRTLYRNVVYALTCDAPALEGVDVEVDGIPKYRFYTTLWHFGDMKWFTISLVRHKDGRVMDVRTIKEV